MTVTDNMTTMRLPMTPAHPRHPLKSRARVLLTSVFGPYAQDDEYGSRKITSMELWHNQVTRVQGPFSLRMSHRSWGLMLIQANILAPCTLLDFPDMQRFIDQITTNEYDVIGISSIIPNVRKVRKMCELIREYAPGATIVVGGHIANLPELDELIDADHIVKGEGVSWMRRFLGETGNRPIVHPRILSGIGTRILGITQSTKPGEVAATLIPSVGCPVGCNFCSTSAMFGGKGSCVNFYETGDELFQVMCDLERDLLVRSFFVMDENFLLHRKRALRLLELMHQHGKSWALYVFASANVLNSYEIEQLVGLGIIWAWVGLEGKDSKYSKLKGTDTLTLVKTLQAHGIRVLGSTIIGLEDHSPENIDEAIDHAVAHDSDFHQFMLYTPLPGTPLHSELQAAGKLLDPSELDHPDTHGQHRFKHRHAHITGHRETEFLMRAFHRDFDVNGPSLVRTARTMLQGWRRYKNHPDRRIRVRFAWDNRGLATMYAGALWAARHWYRKDKMQSAKISSILDGIYEEFGLKSRLAAPLVGRYVRWMMAREESRVRRGWTFEPPTFCETAMRIENRITALGTG